MHNSRVRYILEVLYCVAYSGNPLALPENLVYLINEN